MISSPPGHAGNDGERAWIRLLLGAVVVFLVAAAIRWTGLGQEATHDELYHLLAARSWLADGDLAIAGGEPYGRGASFTRIVALFMSWLGPSLEVARIPVLIAGSLVAATLYGWLRMHGQVLAAWVAGLLVCVDPVLVEISWMLRFYSLQNLAFLVGVIAAVEATVGRRRRRSARLLLAGLAALSLFAAYSLQLASIIGIGALGIALGSLFLPSLLRRSPSRRATWIAAGVFGVLLAAGAAVVAGSRFGELLIRLTTTPDLWGQALADQWRFYYAAIHDRWAVALGLFPALAVFAALRRPRIAAVAALVFALSLVVHSVVAWKAERYIAYILPLFFVVVAIGVVEAVRRLRPLVRKLVGDAMGALGASPRTLRASTLIGVAGIVLFGVASNRAFLQTGRLVTRDHSFSYPFKPFRERPMSWERASGALRPIADQVDVVVASDAIKALHYMGEVDYSMHANSLHQAGEWLPEFTVDRRIGRPVFRRPETLDAVMRCHPTGLIVVERRAWRSRISVRAELADFIAEHAEPVEVPERWGILAYRWETEGAGGPACESVR